MSLHWYAEREKLRLALRESVQFKPKFRYSRLARRRTTGQTLISCTAGWEGGKSHTTAIHVMTRTLTQEQD